MEHSPQSLTRLLLEKFPGERAVICFETEEGADLSQYMKKGYSRTYRNGKTRDMEKSLEDPDAKTQIVTARTGIGKRSKSEDYRSARSRFFGEQPGACTHRFGTEPAFSQENFAVISATLGFEKTYP